jgi:hypothetical protein
MLKSCKGLLAVVCSLLLATAFSLPVAAQSSTNPDNNQSLSNQNQSPGTQSQPGSTQQTTPSDMDRNQSNSDRYNSDVNQSNSDVNRQKPADTGVQDQDTNQNTTNNENLPRTASGLPLGGLIGAISMLGFAIRRWL